MILDVLWKTIPSANRLIESNLNKVICIEGSFAASGADVSFGRSLSSFPYFHRFPPQHEAQSNNDHLIHNPFFHYVLREFHKTAYVVNFGRWLFLFAYLKLEGAAKKTPYITLELCSYDVS